MSRRRRQAHRLLVRNGRFRRASRRAWQAARAGFINLFFRTFHLRADKPPAGIGRAIVVPLVYHGRPLELDQ